MKIRVIINSRKSVSRSFDRLLRNKFGRHECDTCYTRYAGQAGEIARDSACQGYDRIVAVGGDGTINEIANGSLNSGIPIGIIPTGKANDLASQLGIPDKNEQALDIILTGDVDYANAIWANGRIFLTSCGLGFPTFVVASTNALDGKYIISRRLMKYFGHRLYIWGLFTAFSRRLSCHRVCIDYDNNSEALDVISLILGCRPVIGKYFRIQPRAVSAANSINIYAIKKGSHLLLGKNIIGTMRKTGRMLPGARYLQSSQFNIKIEPAATLFGDGELYQTTDRIVARLLPRAVPFMVPAKGGESS